MSHELWDGRDWLYIRPRVYHGSHAANITCTACTNTALPFSSQCHQVTHMYFTSTHRRKCYVFPKTFICTLSSRSDQRGRFLAAMSSDAGSIFVCSGLISKGFTVLGHTGKECTPHSIQWLDKGTCAYIYYSPYHRRERITYSQKKTSALLHTI